MTINYENNKICSNCGRLGHEYKYCKDPITSWGIILVKLCYADDIYTKIKHNKNDVNKSDMIVIKNKVDLVNIRINLNLIQFLLISRKHSLGYVEFIRGRYKPENIDGLIYIFQQMMTEEIEKIKNSDFDTLWIDFWNNDLKTQFYKKEYNESKTKFNILKEKKDIELDLKFYVNNIKSHFDMAEWGFPKGRKVKGETDLQCAIREFTEETGLSENDINILLNIKTIIEDLTGTNGIKYRHIYYLAELKTNNLNIDTHLPLSIEIGNIGFFTFENAMTKIREYHIERKKILTNIYTYYINLLLQNNITNDPSINDTSINVPNINDTNINNIAQISNFTFDNINSITEWKLENDDIMIE